MRLSITVSGMISIQFSYLSVSEGERPESQVGGGVRHGAQDVLDGVDRLQDHHFAETLILVPVAVASSAAVAVGVADRGHDLVGGGAVGNLFRCQEVVGDRIVVATAAVVH